MELPRPSCCTGNSSPGTPKIHKRAKETTHAFYMDVAWGEKKLTYANLSMLFHGALLLALSTHVLVNCFLMLGLSSAVNFGTTLASQPFAIIRAKTPQSNLNKTLKKELDAYSM